MTSSKVGNFVPFALQKNIIYGLNAEEDVSLNNLNRLPSGTVDEPGVSSRSEGSASWLTGWVSEWTLF